MDEEQDPNEEDREIDRKARTDQEFYDTLYGVKDGGFK